MKDIRLATLLHSLGKLVTIMVVFRLVVLCLLTFFNVGVLASNLTSRATGLENIPPCGVSRLSNGSYCAKSCIDPMPGHCDTEQRLFVIQHKLLLQQ
jgi:hypothetical protein